MNKPNPRLSKWAFAFTIFSGALACAHAQSNPPGGASTEPLKLVVGFPPGGALDALARALAEQLRKSTGQTVLIDNRPGASSRLAIDYVKRAPPDGNTVLLSSSAPFVIFPMTYKKVNYDVERDFIPVAHLVEFPSVIFTSAAKPYKTLPQYVEWVKSHPGDGWVGLSSLGGGLHFSVLAMAKEIGVPLNPVPYKGGGAPRHGHHRRASPRRNRRVGQPTGTSPGWQGAHPRGLWNTAQQAVAGYSHREGSRHQWLRPCHFFLQRLCARGHAARCHKAT